MIKLNIGCGTDYREGFVNIDGSDALTKVDKIIDINSRNLTDFYGEGSVDFILANDIIEHMFHWEAFDVLSQFYTILRSGGTAEIRVPDCEWIIRKWRMPIERKLVLLFGGQDVFQGRDAEMDKSRQTFPQFFCHKYGWSKDRMKHDLLSIGFRTIAFKQAATNFITVCAK